MVAFTVFFTSFLVTEEAKAVGTPTYTGVAVPSGGNQTWVTLLGDDLSHDPTLVRTSGYQTVYYKNASSGSWIPFSAGDVRNNPSDSSTIQVYIPTGIQVFLFHIDVCDDYIALTGCVALEQPSSSYTVNQLNVTLHFKNGASDSTTVVDWNGIYQLPKLFETSSQVFKEWNTQDNGSGTAYSAFTNFTVNGNRHFYAQWISKSAARVALYMDAPFVQASYATGPKVKTEDFETHTVGATSCGDAGGADKDFSVGVVTGTCQIANAQYASASTTSSDPFFGGTGGNFATDYPSGPFTVRFDSNQKYVGFWWAAGSPRNQVEFLAGSSVVATMNVDQLFGIFGSLPADYAGSTDSVQAIDSSFYPKKYYFGNPSGHGSLTPTSAGAVSGSEQFVYIHAFAANGAYFDGIRFSGDNFEIDNLTISKASVPINPRLVYVQGIEAQNLDPTQEIYFVNYEGNSNTSGTAPTDSISPYAPGDTATVLGNSGTLARDGYTFAGWNTKSDGTGTNHLEGETVTVNTDVILYSKWNQNAPPPPPPAPAAKELKIPGVVWNPSDLLSGEAITQNNQLNAEFSVPGKAIYSVVPGLVPKIGELKIDVTFTPTDIDNFLVISTSRTVKISMAPAKEPIKEAQSNPDVIPVAEKPISVKPSSLKIFATIYFNNNEYFLDAGDRKKISETSMKLSAAGLKQVIVRGNTDVKTGVDNLWLSKARAEAVAALLSKTTGNINLTKAWYASKRPVAIGFDKASLAKNRRVEILISSEAPTSGTESFEIKAPIKKTFAPVQFNRNEYFLNAKARASLTAYAKEFFATGCKKITLVGTHDQTRGGFDDKIALFRGKAVRDFLLKLDGQLDFAKISQTVSTKREVRIACSNNL